MLARRPRRPISGESSILRGAKPGSGPEQEPSLFLAPRGIPHRFHNEGPEPATLLVIAGPGAGLVHMFSAIDEAGQRADGMPAVEEIVAICADHGVTILPPA
jgi:hypothetical protein